MAGPFDDLIPAAGQPAPHRAVIYGPGNPQAEGQQATPAQADYARRPGAINRDAALGSPQNPWFDAPSGRVPDGASFVDAGGQLQRQPAGGARAGDVFSDLIPPKPGAVEDVLKGGGAGLVRGLASITNMLPGGGGGDAAALANSIVSPLASKAAGLSPDQSAKLAQMMDAIRGRTTGEQMDAAGINYRAQTVPGQYAQTIAEFAPNALAGGEGLIPKIAAVALPAIASETAGQATKGTDAEPWARLLASVVGGGVAGIRGGVPVVGPAATAEALSKLGLDAKSAPPALAEQLQAIPSNVRPDDAAVLAAANTLPVPVPMLQGQVTGLPAQQLAENLALRGGSGPTASLMAKGAQAQQQEALGANVRAIADNIAGPAASLPRGQAGAVVSDALNGLYNSKKSAVDAAYDAARNAPPAGLSPAQGLALVARVKDSVADFDPLRVPSVAREVDRLQGAVAPFSGDLPPGINPARVMASKDLPPVDLKSIFDSRSRLTNLRASNDPVEGKAAALAVKAIDQHLSDALDNDLFLGDPQGVDLWRQAIGQRRDFGKLFQGNDLIEKLTTREPRGGAVQLAVDPQDAANYILGRSNLGFVGRQNLYRDLNRLKGVLGPQSDEWNALRSEAFQRLAAEGNGPMEGGVQQFSGAKFAKAWNGMKQKDPNLVATFFSPQERATIDQFAGVAHRVTTPVRGGDNSSNTAVTAKALGLLRRLPFGGLMEDAVNTGQIRRAISAHPRPMPKPPLDAASILSGAAKASAIPVLTSGPQQ